MKVLIVGHHVENVTLAFRQRGHLVSPVEPLADGLSKSVVHRVGYDLLIAFPPCKYLCSSGLHWNSRVPGRAAQTESALEFVRWLMDLPITRICIENPVGCLSSRIRRPDQMIHPHQFGHDASKKTCLWLTNLPHLVPTQHVAPRYVATGRGTQTLPRWGNQFDSGQNNQVNAPDRGRARAERWQGVADAMAEQWGVL